MKLTVAIPTFNRAKRLEKSLNDLLATIKSSSKKAEVDVFVSNNGSLDTTGGTIEQCKKMYIAEGIPFYSSAFESNQGFDANVLACYVASKGDYIWFLSDDDNILPGAIDAIFADIEAYKPSVIYYNFNQAPYDYEHPYINETQYFSEINSANIIAFKKILRWPKLTSLVINKCLAGLKVPNHNGGFAHVTLALQCGISCGRVLHSAVFIACPDNDYLDHIDFVPFIGNNIDIGLQWALKENKRMSLYSQLALPYCEPLSYSLSSLGAYYRGRFALSHSLKVELWNTVFSEIKRLKYKVIIKPSQLKGIIKFIISYCYYIWYTVVNNKAPTRDR